VLEGVFMRLGEIGDHFAVVPEQFVADGDIVVALIWKPLSVCRRRLSPTGKAFVPDVRAVRSERTNPPRQVAQTVSTLGS